jgi:hypothetical protein
MRDAPSGIRTRLQMAIFLAACTHRCTHAASTSDTNEHESVATGAASEVTRDGVDDRSGVLNSFARLVDAD